MNELSHGVDIEIDMSAIPQDEEDKDCEEDSYRRDEIHKYLNPECTGFGRDDSSASDSEDTMVWYVRLQHMYRRLCVIRAGMHI